MTNISLYYFFLFKISLTICCNIMKQFVEKMLTTDWKPPNLIPLANNYIDLHKQIDELVFRKYSVKKLRYNLNPYHIFCIDLQKYRFRHV